MSDTATLDHKTNPYLSAILSQLEIDEIENHLAFSPLADIDVASIGLQDRYDLLDRMQEELFEPTMSSSEIVTRLYRLIRRGYIARDPRNARVRRRTMEIARLAGDEISKIPGFMTYAKGMRLSGITGIGKSYELIRGLQLLPQYIEHGRNDAAGWTHLAQVVWLYVPMSHDGSLGGLLLQMLVALDEAAGTDYAKDSRLTGLSNEKLAVHIGIIFRNHGLGILVIDELQERNFTGAKAALAATFFLRLLNFGIPVVLAGNPYGLAALDKFSQDMRRLSSGGSFDRHPMELTDFDWMDCYAPAMWGFNVMPEPSPIEDPDGELLFSYCGGIRDYACRIRTSSQRLALDLGDKAVTEEHMKQAYWGPDFSDQDRRLIEGFRDKNPLLLMGFDDIPWESYAAKWGKLPKPQGRSSTVGDEASNPGNTAAASGNTSQPNKTVSEKARIAAQRNRSRKANDAAKIAAMRANLGTDDIRNTGLQELLIAGFEALQKEQHTTS